MANVINAIINLVCDPQLELVDYYNTRNRANAEGDSLEEYVIDLFANTLRESDSQTRLKKINNVFSYLGNDANPPDAILTNDAVLEIKKLKSETTQLQLNSSHPRRTLSSTSPMITSKCRQVEGGKWIDKDILYIVGCVKKKTLVSLFMVYGCDYAASEEVYLRVKNTLKDGVESLSSIKFAETKELGRLNNVDPLGITTLRIRGMWLLQNPWKVFSYVAQNDKSKRFNFCAIINTDKYKSYKEHTQLEKIARKIDALSITDKNIKDPDNPAQLIDVKVITFSI